MVRVGVIDSGSPAGAADGTLAFLPDGSSCPARPDRLGHGTVVAETILRGCPQATIVHAQVFDERPVTTALQIAAALRWFASAGKGEKVDLVCLSLGLVNDRAPLRTACGRVQAEGILIVAAHPARGEPCYPAAYPDVIMGTGDARCGWDELSRLGPRLFGAWCNSPEQGNRGMGGASIGSARLAGHLAQSIAAMGMIANPALAIARLAAAARYHAPEQRGANREDTGPGERDGG